MWSRTDRSAQQYSYISSNDTYVQQYISVWGTYRYSGTRPLEHISTATGTMNGAPAKPPVEAPPTLNSNNTRGEHRPRPNLPTVAARAGPLQPSGGARYGRPGWPPSQIQLLIAQHTHHLTPPIYTKALIRHHTPYTLIRHHTPYTLIRHHNLMTAALVIRCELQTAARHSGTRGTHSGTRGTHVVPIRTHLLFL